MNVPDKKMQNYRSKLKRLMRPKGFTLLELLVVISIVALLVGILLPCLMRAKESAYELFAMQTEPDKEGEVRLEITNPAQRKAEDDLYLIKIRRPGIGRFVLNEPHPSGMKLTKRDGQEYIKWRPEWDDIGVHPITVVFEGEKVSEQEITIYVFNRKLLEARQKDKAEAD